MIDAAGTRIGWSDLPRTVRRGVEDLLGDTVVEAVSQRGGFSPGTADRVVTDGGRRAFVKAVSPGLDVDAAAMHRREARIAALLPATLPVPALLGSRDDGDWVVLVLEDVEGRQPAVPWRADELGAVLAALSRLASLPVPSELSVELPEAPDVLAPVLTGWERLNADPPAGLDGWASSHVEDLVALADDAGAAVSGVRLVHGDTRSDNFLVRPDGSVVVVDWPHACVGCGWLDTLTGVLDVRLHDDRREHDVEALLAPVTAGVDPDAVTAVLAGLTGYFLDAARQPPPARLPTLRAFQAAEGAAALGWLRERLGDRA